ncbi:MAG: Fe-S cluster assembly protein SufD [Elusimicrobia bacterium]|nr:Fe-S cluster assembly protein SufD [Elusimicrobiota bacterium]
MNAALPSTIKDLSKASVTALSADRKEPAWALELRLAALENFLALPWPDSKDERWKRTPLDQLSLDQLSPAAGFTRALPGIESLQGQLKALGHSAPGNGNAPARRFSDFTLGQTADIPELFRQRNVEWLSLDEAVKSRPDLIRAAWEAAVTRSKQDKFRSLVLALANGGSCLIVPRGQVLKAPFMSYVGGGEAGQAYFPLNFFFLEEAAEAQVWEELVGRDSGDGAMFVASYTAIEMKENAKGGFYYLQRWDQGTAHLQFQDVVQKGFSRFNAVAVSMGGRVFRNETVVNLEGQGAENKVLGVLFGEKNQNFENWISQMHLAPKTTSDIQYRGALKGAAHSFFSGLVSIKKEAQQSDAYQAAKTLLLSNEAKADAIPNLEILADDVKCSHGAAVGPVDEDQKFYLRARGIDPTLAEKMIVEGFFEPVIAEVPSEAVRERLRSFIDDKLKT